MHLVYECLEGVTLPTVLPASLLSSGTPNQSTGETMLALMPPTPLHENGDMAICPLPTVPSSDFAQRPVFETAQPVMPAPQFSVPLKPKLPDWIITPDELAASDTLFNRLDSDADGLLSGMQVKEIFMQSNLPSQTLAAIWDLVDFQSTSGYLNHEQFVVATHLLKSQIPTPGFFPNPLPKTLPHELLPPSLRPIELDSTHYLESTQLIQQLEKLKKDRLDLENECLKLDTSAHMKANEVANASREADTLMHALDSLNKQKEMADSILLGMEERRTQMETQLSGLQVSPTTHAKQ
ncbi:Epidermal growth factor receptor substrate 15 [Cichlidogyrus casuarinus]|uniref:Epidermal growth factor receptor substrate 15 n=1 Tax=Cichlidogyrus casuarinus TaxID=1844966 RepID=A0ABD2PMX7_9PLAT